MVAEEIQSAFRNLNLKFFPDNILFYDALKYYHRTDTGKLEKAAMLLATTVERGEGNTTEEGEIQEDTNDTELNFRGKMSRVVCVKSTL